jgi:hypothetical protein
MLYLTGTVERVTVAGPFGDEEDLTLILEGGERVSVGALGLGPEWVGKKVNLTLEEWVDPHPKCRECGGDLGGRYLGRLESHKADCPLFPL